MAKCRLIYSLGYKEKWEKTITPKFLEGKYKLAQIQVYKLIILTSPSTQMHIYTQCICMYVCPNVYS